MNGTLLQKPSARRVIGMVVGIVIIGLGIALFKQSHLGNDSISALNMRLAELFGISLGVQNIAANLLMFAIEIWVGRQYIGLGTFVNGICIGFIVTAFYDPIAAFFGPAASLPEQLLWVAAAVIVTALGASLYQTADLGIAPYDALALELRDHTPVPYFGCRVFTDAVCALACWMLGGLVGLGTLICAFCLGPVIQFFNGFRKTIFDRIFVCAAGDRVFGCIPLVRQPFRRGHTFICTTARFIDFDIRTKHSLFHLKNFRRFYVQCFGNFFRFAGTEKLGVVL